MIRSTLLIGLLGLMIASCGSESNKETTDTPVNVEVKSVGELTIAYYVYDSLVTNFDFFVETFETLEKKGAAIEKKMAAQQQIGQKAATALQSGYEQQILSDNQIQAYQNKIAQAENEIARIQQNQLLPFQNEQAKMNEILNNKITAYGNEFAKKHQIKLFLVQMNPGQIAYVDPSFDKTMEFVDFMNTKEEEINNLDQE